MARMKELYENIWFDFVQEGMSVEDISSFYNVPLDWVTSALEQAEQDEHYDNIHSKTTTKQSTTQ